MKKLIPLLIGLLLLVSITGAIFYFPLPINGRVINPLTSEGLTVEVTNLRSGYVMIEKVNGAGEFLIEWANSEEVNGMPKYMIGDKFRIVIKECSSNSLCVKEVVYSGQNEIFNIFDLTGLNIVPPQPEPEIIPEPEMPDWAKVGIGVLITLIVSAIAFFGGGLKIYRNTLGKAVLQHKHKGIRGYHDPNVSHKNPLYRHVSYKVDPVKCFNDVKIIEEKGGL